MFDQYKDFFEVLFLGFLLSAIGIAVLEVIMKKYLESKTPVEEFKNEAEIIILEDHRNNKKNLNKDIILNFKNDDLYKKNIS